MAFSAFIQNSKTSEQKLKDAVKSNDINELQNLLRDGINPNLRLQTHGGNTALHFAATDGYTEVIDHLLQAGADPNLVNDHGSTPLIDAFRSNQCGTFLKLLPVTDSGDLASVPAIQCRVSEYYAWCEVLPDMKKLLIKATPSIGIFLHYDKNVYIREVLSKNLEELIMCGLHINYPDAKRTLEMIAKSHRLSISNFEINDIDSIDRVQTKVYMKDFLSFLKNAQMNPLSLQQVCRIRIRKSFVGKCNVFYGVNLLMLPTVLKDYICLM